MYNVKFYLKLLFSLVFAYVSYTLYYYIIKNIDIKDIDIKTLTYIIQDPKFYIAQAIFIVLFFIILTPTSKNVKTKVKDTENKTQDTYTIETKTLTPTQIKKATEMPKKMGLSVNVKDVNFNLYDLKKEEKNEEIFDKLAKITPTELIYTNKTGYINFNKYKQLENDIKQYLDLDYIEITRYKDNAIKIRYVDVLNIKNFTFNFDTMLKPQHIYFGINRDMQSLFIPISKLTHTFITGQTGAGKSVFQNVLLASIFYNMWLDRQNNTKTIDKVYLIDLKGGVEFYNYRYIDKEKIEVVDNIQDLYNVIDNVKNVMHKRLEMMKKQGIKNISSKFIFLIFDEYGQVADNKPIDMNEMKKYNKLQDDLRSLAALARAAGIRLFITTQRGTSDSIDTTMRDNLPTRVIMKQQSTQAIIPMIGGSLEVLDELGVDPKTFGYGRFIFVDPTTTFSKGVKYHVAQSPFIDENFYISFIDNKELQELLVYRNAFANALQKAYAQGLQEVEVLDVKYSIQEIENNINAINKKLEMLENNENTIPTPPNSINDNFINDKKETNIEEAFTEVLQAQEPLQTIEITDEDKNIEKYVQLTKRFKALYKTIKSIEDKDKRQKLLTQYKEIKEKMDTFEKETEVVTDKDLQYFTNLVKGLKNAL